MSKSKSSYPKEAQAQYQQPHGQYPAYPSAPPAYPSAPPPYSAAGHPPGPGAPAPPPYNYQPGPNPYMMPAPYPQQTSYNVTMVPQNAPASNYNPGYPVQPGFQYNPNAVAVASFDSGARFDGIASPNIPPPPPGCAPNAAQMASAQGRSVVGTQQKASWFSGGSGGGVSFW